MFTTVSDTLNVRELRILIEVLQVDFLLNLTSYNICSTVGVHRCLILLFMMGLAFSIRDKQIPSTM